MRTRGGPFIYQQMKDVQRIIQLQQDYLRAFQKKRHELRKRIEVFEAYLRDGK